MLESWVAKGIISRAAVVRGGIHVAIIAHNQQTVLVHISILDIIVGMHFRYPFSYTTAGS